MLRLSIKDIRIYWFTYFINFAFWTIMAPAAIQSPDIYMMLPIGFGLLIIMIPLGNDVRDGRDVLFASLPIKRNKIVAAKYLSSIFLITASFLWLLLLGLALEKLLPGLAGGLTGALSVESVLIIFFITILIVCIYLPIVFKFGFGAVISGGIAIIGIVMSGFLAAVLFIISLNPQVSDAGSIQAKNLLDVIDSGSLFSHLGSIIRYHGRTLIMTLILLAMAAVLAVSIYISVSIFRRKEL